MATTLTTVAVSAMVGVLVGALVKDSFGAKRSSVGVHRKNGQIMSFPEGLIMFGLITLIAGGFSTVVSTILVGLFSGLGAVVVSVLGVGALLHFTSYSR